MERIAAITILSVITCALVSCSNSDQRSSQQEPSEPQRRGNSPPGEANTIPTLPEQDKRRDPTVAYWKSFLEILKEEHEKSASLSGDQLTESNIREAARIAELPVLNVDDELVNLANEFSKVHLALSAANDEAVKHNAKIDFVDYVGNEIVESLSTGRPGAYYQRFNKEAREGRAKLDAIMQRRRDRIAELLKMRATLTQRYGIEFPLLK